MSERPVRAGDLVNPRRRALLKGIGGLAAAALGGRSGSAGAHAYAGYVGDDRLERVVTSCAHNCGSRHMLVAHKKDGVIVRLSSDDGRESGGLDTPDVPQLRACLRGRAYRARLYAPERLLYPMIRVGARGEGRFKRASWDEALELVAQWMTHIKTTHGPTAILDQSYAGSSWGVLHKSDQIEGLQARFLGMFGCRTCSWSVPSYQGSSFSANVTFGTLEDGNEDDAFAHAKLVILWGWNPAYTFHGGNTVWYLRQAKQKGCKFVVVDPQYTDSAQAFDAWWIPIKPGTDAALLAAMAQVIFAENRQDQTFINRFCQGADAATMPDWAKGQESFRDYIEGRFDGQAKTPEWAAPITGVSPDDIRKLARLYAATKPAALKASWAPGRAAYGEQYARMAAALQAITGNVGKLGGSAEGVGKAWPAQSIAYPYDEYANVWYAAIKSDCWARLVLDYPDVGRETIGLWPRADQWDGFIPNIRAIFWQGSNWLNQLPNVNQALRAIEKLDLVVCLEQTITPSALYADVLLPVCTHFERHDVAVPWYKGHYYIHRPKVIAPLGESKTDFQIYTELAYRLGFGERFNPRASRAYFDKDDAVDDAYLKAWWEGRVMGVQGIAMAWEEFKAKGVYKHRPARPHVAFQDQIEKGLPFATASGKIEIFSGWLAGQSDWTKTIYGAPIPPIPKWIEPWEWLGSPKTADYPFHMVTPHPRERTHSIFHNVGWLRETVDQDLTMNAADAARLGLAMGDTVEVWNGRGALVVPLKVSERVRPGVVVLHEGAWFDRDADGIDRAGNPDLLTLDRPSPAGAFAFNTLLVNVRKSARDHRPGWDRPATARSFRHRRRSDANG